MLGPDPRDKLESPDTNPRRKSTLYQTIWSVSSTDEQQQLNLDNPADSPARPPPTPLPQHNQYYDGFPSRNEGLVRTGSGFDGSRHYTKTDSAGLGLLDYSSIANGTGANNNGEAFRSRHNQGSGLAQNAHGFLQRGGNAQSQVESNRTQAQDQSSTPSSDQGHGPSHTHYWHEAPALERPHPNLPKAQTGSIPDIQPQMQHFPPSGHDSSYSSYYIQNPNLYRMAKSNTPFSHLSPDSNSGMGRVPPPYSISPAYREPSMSREDHIELSPIEDYLRLTSPHHQLQRQNSNAHMRRHSSGETLSSRNADPAWNNRVGYFDPAEVNRILKQVDEYLTTDQHKRVRINYALVASRLATEGELLGPEYRLVDFDRDYWRQHVGNSTLVLVAFKAGRLDVFYVPAQSRELQQLQVGNMVFVEADRGRDLGRISKVNISVEEARVLKMLECLEEQNFFGLRSAEDFSLRGLQAYDTKYSGSASSGSMWLSRTPKAVLGLASSLEATAILTKKIEEERACNSAIDRIFDIINKPTGSREETEGSPKADATRPNPEDLRLMSIIDAEYQFDRKKLTIYYSSPRRLEFRFLVRELFSIFKTRIWLSAAVGVPHKIDRNSADRRHSSGSREESSRGRLNMLGNRGSGRFPVPRPTQSPGVPSQRLRGQQSSDIFSGHPMPPQVTTQDSPVPDASTISQGLRLLEDSGGTVMKPEVPRILRDGSHEKNGENSDAEEKWVSKSLVDTLNN